MFLSEYQMSERDMCPQIRNYYYEIDKNVLCSIKMSSTSNNFSDFRYIKSTVPKYGILECVLYTSIKTKIFNKSTAYRQVSRGSGDLICFGGPLLKAAIGSYSNQISCYWLKQVYNSLLPFMWTLAGKILICYNVVIYILLHHFPT